MTSVRIFLDILLAATALSTPLFDFAPKTKTFRLSTYMPPLKTTARPTTTPRVAKALPTRSPTYTVTATVYEAVPNQTDDEPFVTADNSRIKPHYGSKKRWMALSRDLLKQWGGKFDYGDKVRVKGISPELDGVYTVHDTMNRRHRRCMDILAHTSENLNIFTPGVRIQKVAYR